MNQQARRKFNDYETQSSLTKDFQKLFQIRPIQDSQAQRVLEVEKSSTANAYLSSSLPNGPQGAAASEDDLEECPISVFSKVISKEGQLFSSTALFQMLYLQPEILVLKLIDCGITAIECKCIASNPHASSVELLDLSCNPIKLTGFLNLISKSSSRLQNVRELNLYLCQINADQIPIVGELLFNGKKIDQTNLIKLNLSHNKLGQLASHILGSWIQIDNLHHLQLEDCELEEPAQELLALSVQFMWDLKMMNLSCNTLKTEHLSLLFDGMRKLLTFPSLILEKCSFTEGLSFNQGKQEYGYLTELDMSLTPLSEEDCINLSEARCLQGLKLLKLEQCQLTSTSFKHIVGSTIIINLEILLVQKNHIERVKVKILRNFKPELLFMRLKLLDIRDNPIEQCQMHMCYGWQFSQTVILGWDKDNSLNSYHFDMEERFLQFRRGQKDYSLPNYPKPIHITTANALQLDLADDI
ncbi:hypothetical protein FGO68_gene8912 [Halteria grandinella]|uniref:Uncharacterized protein n=1 Tax=Halteria grandinella TaxID=5974 RepID=A0A8J8NP86_HALGN|nr:hypothetical protein FGO68_gene8912 [Halteria grandinella]